MIVVKTPYFTTVIYNSRNTGIKDVHFRFCYKYYYNKISK